MKCPNCGDTIKLVAIQEKQIKYGMLERFRCPSCHVWLKLNSSLALLQTAGFTLVLIGSLLAIFKSAPNNIQYSILAFLGAALALICAILNKPTLLKE